MLVSEPMGTLLVNERMLETYLYARDHYLKPGMRTTQFETFLVRSRVVLRCVPCSFLRQQTQCVLAGALAVQLPIVDAQMYGK